VNTLPTAYAIGLAPLVTVVALGRQSKWTMQGPPASALDKKSSGPHLTVTFKRLQSNVNG
jgi:hypothetical protein